jgi:hypothetical protein
LWIVAAHAVFSQRPQQHQDDSRRDGSIGHVKDRPPANLNEIHNRTEAKAIGEIAQCATQDQTDANSQEPTGLLLRAIKHDDDGEDKERGECKDNAQLRKVAARRARIGARHKSQKIDPRNRIADSSHANIFKDEILGELIQEEHDQRYNADDYRTWLETRFAGSGALLFGLFQLSLQKL